MVKYCSRENILPETAILPEAKDETICTTEKIICEQHFNII